MKPSTRRTPDYYFYCDKDFLHNAFAWRLSGTAEWRTSTEMWFWDSSGVKITVEFDSVNSEAFTVRRYGIDNETEIFRGTYENTTRVY